MFDFEKCKVCTEKRCDLAFLQKTPEQREEETFLKKAREVRKGKLKNYWLREKKYYRKMADNEMAMVNYDRKPYMNDSDWRHDANWFICIEKMMELDELYYNGLETLYSTTIEDLI